VEINSSFYRPHKPATYARWAASVPPGFQFSVKIPREITHVRKLVDATEVLDRFLAEVGALGDKLGPLLVQLPPSLRFDPAAAGAFFALLRDRFDGDLACEPRHATWFTADADALLHQFCVARVAADPAPVPLASHPGGWPKLIYRRLHGSPRMYYSGYTPDCLAQIADLMRSCTYDTWCIFDNTALGEATRDALDLLQCLQPY
jgi:uncharacterized protein YecE (DUF72 family)